MFFDKTITQTEIDFLFKFYIIASLQPTFGYSLPESIPFDYHCNAYGNNNSTNHNHNNSIHAHNAVVTGIGKLFSLTKMKNKRKILAFIPNLVLSKHFMHELSCVVKKLERDLMTLKLLFWCHSNCCFLFDCYLYNMLINSSECGSSSNAMCTHTTVNTHQFRFIDNEWWQWFASSFVLAE